MQKNELLVIFIIKFFIVTLFKNSGNSVIMLVASTSQYLIRFTSFVHIKRKSGFSLINKQILVFISKILLHCSVCLVPIFLLLHKVVYLSSPFVIIAIAAILFYAILLPTGLMLKIDYTTSIKKLLK